MKKNGESIYGTQASPFATLAWGRCTQKKTADGHTRLYLHVFDWPKDGKLVIPTTATHRVLGARLLGRTPGLSVTRTATALTVSLPSAAPDPIATVVVLDVAAPITLSASPAAPNARPAR
jgi:alpha-L-fucosidase